MKTKDKLNNNKKKMNMQDKQMEKHKEVPKSTHYTVRTNYGSYCALHTKTYANRHTIAPPPRHRPLDPTSLI